MSSRPRTPGPSAPAPGKLALPELAEMKRRGDRISMVTAYDAPAALLADEAGVELILVGDSAAMVMLGHDSTLAVTLDEMIFLTRAVTRSARRPLVIGDLPFGSLRGLRRTGRRKRDPAGQGGRRRHGQARGRRAGWSRACARSPSRTSVWCAHRPHAAVGDEARRLPRAGPHRRGGPEALRRRARARRTRAASRSCSRPFPPRSRRGSPRRSRCRRSGSAPAPAATARCSSGTTCSASTRARRRGSSSATPSSPARSGARSRAFVARRARRRLPRGAAHLLDSRRGARPLRGRARRASTRGGPAPAPTASGAAAATAARGQLQPCTARTPITSSAAAQTHERRARSDAKTSAPPPASGPPLRNSVARRTARA